jgi:hypothetical protein
MGPCGLLKPEISQKFLSPSASAKKRSTNIFNSEHKQRKNTEKTATV